ncbi:MAG: hypothetical protein CL931_06160 [Deltaproteobacteria bacterium]|nr:hypothetical protein [Deltaproteobacteria bacterium]
MISTFGLTLTIFVAGWIALGALQRRSIGFGSRAFACFGVLIAAWAGGELMVMTASDTVELRWARRVFYLASAGLPAVWLWLGIRAAEPRWYVENPRRILAAFVLPLFFYSCLYWERTGLFIEWEAMPPSQGPWFHLFMNHQYLISLVGTGYFLKAAMRLGRSSFAAMATIASGVALPIVVNLAYYFRVTESDWTAVALGPAVLMIWSSAIEAGLVSNLSADRSDVIDQLDVGVIVAGPDGRIVSANRAAERLSEIDHLPGLLLPEAVAAAEQRLDAVIESREIALSDRLGTTGHALILTDRTEAESSRRRLELGGRLEALGSLTAGIAHEVNNPLAFIQANLSSLESTAKQLSDPAVRRLLGEELQEGIGDLSCVIEETQEGVERIRELVQRLKTFSRTPDLTATAVEVDLVRAVQQASAVACIGQAGTAIRVEGAPRLSVISIETAVFQILVNLLLNAVQADSEQPDVSVSLEAREQGAWVRVADRGPGIQSALLPRIFDPFFTTKATGTGLGLSLSFDLARQLGGDLSAENREGGGACFSLWLPWSSPQASEAEEEAPTAFAETLARTSTETAPSRVA